MLDAQFVIHCCIWFGIIVLGSREVPRFPIGPHPLTVIRDPLVKILTGLIPDYNDIIQMVYLSISAMKKVRRRKQP